MGLTLVTGPALEPVTLAEAKAHCRVDDTADDALIDGLRVTARQHVEAFTGRALITQTWDLKLAGFPCGEFAIPRAPAISVDAITYIDTAGETQTWATENYVTDLPEGPHAAPGRIAPAYGISYPSVQCVLNAVTVRFTAGYGPNTYNVPEAIRAAIKLMTAHLYEQRQPVNVGNIVTPIPMSIETLLWPFKVFV